MQGKEKYQDDKCQNRFVGKVGFIVGEFYGCAWHICQEKAHDKERDNAGQCKNEHCLHISRLQDVTCQQRAKPVANQCGGSENAQFEPTDLAAQCLIEKSRESVAEKGVADPSYDQK